MRYLLDTNIISDLMRNRGGKCAARLAEAGSENVCTSVVVACELRYGVAKKRSAELSRRLHAVLGAMDVLPFEPPADVAYAQHRTKLEAQGTPIGSNDLLIAAHALAIGATLVTDNDKEFARITGLQVENWLR
jgi:tRNA(fMet)-specific endonuclease VapC